MNPAPAGEAAVDRARSAREAPGADSEMIDLDAYLRRIGLQTSVAPNPQTLRAIVAAHVAAIPFENLDPFLGITPSLDIASVQQKLVRNGRGGYCFEHNRLLSDALRAIGFDVTDLGARVLWGQSEDAITARSHMLLRVEIEGRSWLADAGFGGNTPTAPLELVPDIEQATPHEPYRLIRRSDSDWRLQLFAADAWQTLYRFDLQPQFPADYRVSNYWTSTNPDSHFVSGLTAARAPAGRRLALRNRQFTEYTTGGGTTRRTLATTAEIRAILQDEFLIPLPERPKLGEMLDRLPE
ncbi:MAG TPA: arylamine N-acetyltransferase [Rhodanobacteraceae bacterium]|jgi:N-hydroxyarylamine O-acetyltransferase|nr:arylamine N-acetyltransferase [Rhodanobacteraceae bacterium]